FHVWELRGRYPEILNDATYGGEARRLFADAQALLADLIAHERLEARGVFGFFPANSDGDDIVLYADESAREVRAVFHTLRQQTPKEDGNPNLALADFVAPRESGRLDYLGGFAITAGHGLEDVVRHFQEQRDDYSAILAEALADRLAEAGAEYLHEQARREWGYGRDERLSKEELLRERYRGIRPAPGYPSQPDHTEKRTLFALLGAEEAAGVRLTESCAMWPASS